MINKENGQKELDGHDQEDMARTDNTDVEVESVKKMLKKKELQTKVLKKIIEENTSSNNK